MPPKNVTQRQPIAYEVNLILNNMQKVGESFENSI